MPYEYDDDDNISFILLLATAAFVAWYTRDLWL